MELTKNHKWKTKACWKRRGLDMTNFEGIYLFYINCEYCELCNKKFTKSTDRQMEHNHQTGEFRNVVCLKCNQRKADNKIQSNNTTGYKGINKQINKKYKLGYRWVFQACVDGKLKTIKSSVNKEKLIEFSEKWKKDNNYYT